MTIKTTITDSPMYNGDVDILLQTHDGEWCVVSIAPTEGQEDPEEWHYKNPIDALNQYQVQLNRYLPEPDASDWNSSEDEFAFEMSGKTADPVGEKPF